MSDPQPASRVSKLRVSERQIGDVAVVLLAGELTLDDGDLVLGRAIDALIAAGRFKIVIDLSEVTYIDSAGVGMMVAEQKAVQRHGGSIKLAGVTARSHHLFAMLKLKIVFEIFDNAESAARSGTWDIH
jgi:anti-sigma B factor antagonist